MVSKKRLFAELIVKLWVVPSTAVALCCWVSVLVNR